MLEKVDEVYNENISKLLLWTTCNLPWACFTFHDSDYVVELLESTRQLRKQL